MTTAMIRPDARCAEHRTPGDVLADATISATEKRMILSSWASDRYAVEDYPWLRKIPGEPAAIALKDILAALRKLDRDNDPPPRGAGAMRQQGAASRRPSSSEGSAVAQGRIASGLGILFRGTRDGIPIDEKLARIRAARSNIRRYRRILATPLTDLERAFVTSRLAEEERIVRECANSGLQRHPEARCASIPANVRFEGVEAARKSAL